jgi:hypothetical protein
MRTIISGHLYSVIEGDGQSAQVLIVRHRDAKSVPLPVCPETDDFLAGLVGRDQNAVDAFCLDLLNWDES